VCYSDLCASLWWVTLTLCCVALWWVTLTVCSVALWWVTLTVCYASLWWVTLTLCCVALWWVTLTVCSVALWWVTIILKQIPMRDILRRAMLVTALWFMKTPFTAATEYQLIFHIREGPAGLRMVSRCFWISTSVEKELGEKTVPGVDITAVCFCRSLQNCCRYLVKYVINFLQNSDSLGHRLPLARESN
jgi:hypothetical protein